MTNDDSLRIPYHPTLYVPRRDAEVTVQQWLAGNGRLLTITSPPATGKSWLLRWIESNIRESANSPNYWLDVRPFLISNSTPLIGTYILDSNRLDEWLEQFLTQTKQQCPSVPSYEPGVASSVLLEEFAQAIQECWPGHKLYLLVEGGDEPNQETWRIIERQILEPIARVPNWRFIIVMRQEQRLFSYILRRDEQQLYLGAMPSPSEAIEISVNGRQQIENLLSAEPQNTALPSLAQILTVLPHYPWSHPGLNHFLYLEIKTNHLRPQPQWLSNDYVLSGLCAITKLPPETIKKMYSELKDVSNSLAQEWTPEDIVQLFTLSNVEAWQRIEQFKNAWLVENVSRNRFKITDGVREFVR